MFLSKCLLSRARFLNPWTLGSLDTKKTLNLLNQSLRKITEEIEIPHIDPVSKKVETKRFFEKIDQTGMTQSSHTKIFLYGGVVRSMLGYLSLHLHSKYERQQACISTNQALEEFLDTPPKLTALDILGVGSDLDIVYKGSGQPSKDLQPLEIIIKELIDAYRNSLPEGFVNQYLATSGDVLEYGPQVRRSMAQGGSPLDWLAFPLTSRSGTRILVPDAQPEILNQLLQGKIHFSPIQDPNNYKTIARQIRPLLEMPYLEPTPDSLPHLIQSIEYLSSSYQKEKTTQAVDQIFEKAVRNARFLEACNAYACLDPVSASPLQKAVHVLSRQKTETPLIPEFLPSIEIVNRTDDFDPGNFSAQGFLISNESFIKECTDGGLLYHGTPSLVNVACMIRVGLQVSTEQQDRPQGQAAYGRGFYMTPSFAEATEYAQAGGITLGLEICRSRKLRILSTQKLPDQLLENLQKEAESLQKDFHEYLCDQYAIDIILALPHKYILIQNARALIIPKTIEEWTKSLSHNWQHRLKNAYDIGMSPQASLRDLSYLLKEFRSLDQMHMLSGNTSYITPQAVTWIASRLKLEPPCNQRKCGILRTYLVRFLTKFIKEGQTCPEAVQIATISIQSNDHDEYYYAAELFQALFNKNQGYLEAIEVASRLLNSKTKAHRGESLLKDLARNGYRPSETIQLALTLMKSHPLSDISTELFKILFDQGHGYVEAIQAAVIEIQSDARRDPFSPLKLFQLLFDKGHGYLEAIQVALKLIDSETKNYLGEDLLLKLARSGYRPSEMIQLALTLSKSQQVQPHFIFNLFKILFNQGYGYSEAIQIASAMLYHDASKHYALELFDALFEKGHGHSEAIQLAFILIQSNEPYQYWTARRLLENLRLKGPADVEATIQIASTMIRHDATSKHYALGLFDTLFEKGHGYSEAVQLAIILMKSNDPSQYWTARRLLKNLCLKGPTNLEAVRVATTLLFTQQMHTWTHVGDKLNTTTLTVFNLYRT